MDNKLSKKLGFVLKAKIIKEMNLDNKERRKWLNKSKREIIDYCLNNNIFTPEKINELYNLYKNSANAVLYLIETNISTINYSLITEDFIKSKIYEVNKNNSEDKISDFSLEVLEIHENYLHITFTYTKQIDVIYGGYPEIAGYNVGDILTLKVIEEASVLHYLKYKRFVVKCNDWSAMKGLKDVIEKTFLCAVYHPKFTKELIDKITLNPDGKTHIIKAAYLNQKKESKEPASISLSDNDLKEIKLFSSLEGNSQYSKIYNCFMVDINGTPRFVGISNNKGKLWIPASLDKTELEQFTVAILERVEKTLQQLQNEPTKYIGVFDNYRFSNNAKVNEILREIAIKIVSKNEKESLSDNFYFNIIRYAKKHFQIILKPYFCDEHQIFHDIECLKCKCKNFQLTTNKDKVYIKCEECSLKIDLLSYLDGQKTKCCERKFEITSYADIFVIVPTRATNEVLKKFLESINYKQFEVDFFYILDGELKQIKECKSDEILRLNHFGPFKKILNTPNYRQADKEILKIRERCLRYNPKIQFCVDCAKGLLGKNLEGTYIGNNELHKDNKIRICLPSLFGYCAGLKLDGFHSGGEKADIKFLYDENLERIFDNDSKDTKGLKRVGIHVKSAVKNNPKDLNNPKLTSALGHMIISKIKNEFDIIGIAIPNELNEEIMNELSFVSRGLGINLLIIDKNDWIKIYSYYIEQENFKD